MAHSRNTSREADQAKRGIARTPDGDRILPPIISRRPQRGDQHPLSASRLELNLSLTKTEYLYGLNRIELKARSGTAVGEPFGCYYLRERVIALYSLPPIWDLDRLSNGWQELLLSYGARVRRGTRILVSWPHDTGLMLWFWDQVVMHELGHHYVEQYRNKNGRIRSRKAHEGLANLHVGRYLSRRYQRLQQL